MILGRLRGHQDTGSLAGALVKGGLVVVKAGKLLLALASFAAYAWLFTWQFAVIIVGMLVIHECGHLRCMTAIWQVGTQLPEVKDDDIFENLLGLVMTGLLQSAPHPCDYHRPAGR